MTPETLTYLETSTPNHRHTIVWLHGLGADGHDLQAFARHLNISMYAETRQVFPHAPFRLLDRYGDEPIRAWYRFGEGPRGQAEDANDMREIITLIEELLLRERNALPEGGRILLGGFSQGGVIALASGLSGRVRVDGIVALSAYYWEPAIPIKYHAPVFMGHGMSDPIIPPDWAHRSALWLKRQGITVDWHEYPMAHSICQEEIDDLSQWLEKCLTIQLRALHKTHR